MEGRLKLWRLGPARARRSPPRARRQHPRTVKRQGPVPQLGHRQRNVILGLLSSAAHFLCAGHPADRRLGTRLRPVPAPAVLCSEYPCAPQQAHRNPACALTVPRSTLASSQDGSASIRADREPRAKCLPFIRINPNANTPRRITSINGCIYAIS